ncbi:hypothetical protein [Rhizobium sp.]|uniref:hypothetical protein n=1 Tax=Rhizobium sp. TaxID=391 RepID=UPI002AA7CED5
MIRFAIDPDAKIAKPADAKTATPTAPAPANDEQPKAPAKARKTAAKRPADQDDEKTLL